MEHIVSCAITWFCNTLHLTTIHQFIFALAAIPLSLIAIMIAFEYRR